MIWEKAETAGKGGDEGQGERFVKGFLLTQRRQIEAASEIVKCECECENRCPFHSVPQTSILKKANS